MGRLDADTTGVLPSHERRAARAPAHAPALRVDKVYEAEVEGEPDDQTLARLAEGLELDSMTALARGGQAHGARLVSS